jgi:hypothetical protein
VILRHPDQLTCDFVDVVCQPGAHPVLLFAEAG